MSKPDGRYIPVRVCNPMNEPVTVYRGTCFGMVSSAEIVKVVNSSERVNRVNRIEVCDKVVPEHLVTLYNRSISDLPEAFHKPVSDLLCNNADVFAKNDQDFTLLLDWRLKLNNHPVSFQQNMSM